jgi:K+-transporting ATPase ATPase A chain
VIFVVLLVVCAVAEQNGHTLVKQGVDHTASALQAGGNMEGKEVRFGIANSALWATATLQGTVDNVNRYHDILAAQEALAGNPPVTPQIGKTKK